MKVYGLFIIVIVGLFAGCFTSTKVVKPVAGAEAIQIITAEPPSTGCRYLGEVMGNSQSMDVAKATQYARVDIKNKAAKLGGNLVKLDTNNAGNDYAGGGTQVVLIGRAFRCSN